MPKNSKVTKPEKSASQQPKSQQATESEPQSDQADSLPPGEVPPLHYVIFLLIAGAGCAADLVTKSWMFAELGLHGFKVWGPFFGLIVGYETTLNYGALFGMGQGKVWLFSSLSFVALLGIVYWLVATRAARDLFLTVSLAMITGGIMGNLYDRLGLWGGKDGAGQTIYAVRDWILFRWNGHTWPNFNIADSLLVCGAIALVVHAFLYSDNDSPKRTSDGSPKR